MPARAVRSAHDHEHPGHAARRKCTQPFTPAAFGADGSLIAPASGECRTSDITLAEFKTLRGKMDAFNPARADAGGVPRRHAELPHRSLRRPDRAATC